MEPVGHMPTQDNPSPGFLVPRANKEPRLVVDFRWLNKCSELPRRFPVDARDLWEGIVFSGSKIFSELDMSNAYRQHPVTKKTMKVMAFSIAGQTYASVGLEMGWAGSPFVFSASMAEAFQSCREFCVTYIDNIYVFTKTEEEHLVALRKVLEVVKKYNLHLKPAGCHFMKREMTMLGRHVSGDGFSIPPRYITAITKIPFPTTIKAVQRFIGMANFFRDHIQGFSAKAKPFTSLMVGAPAGRTKVAETPGTLKAFSDIKTAMTTAPMLRFAEFDRPFVLLTDASDVAVGAALLQPDKADWQLSGVQGRDFESGIGDLHPVGFFSKTLNSAQRNYSATMRELWAIKEALLFWAHLLRAGVVYVYTDHRAITFLEDSQDSNKKLARWALEIQDLRISIRYIPGVRNMVADALSRSYVASAATGGQKAKLEASDGEKFELPAGAAEYYTRARMLEEQRVRGIKIPTGARSNCFSTDPEGVVMFNGKCFVPQEVRIRLLRHHHIVHFHASGQRLADLVRQRFDWPGLTKDALNVAKNCLICAQSKADKMSGAATLKSPMTQDPGYVNHRVHVDLITVKEVFILTIMDGFSRYLEAAILGATKKSERVATAFSDKWLHVFGVPTFVLSDNGGEFNGEPFQTLLRSFGIRHMRTSPHHPQTNGVLERAHGDIKHTIRKLEQEQLTLKDENSSLGTQDLAKWLRSAVRLHNVTTNRTVKISPFEIMFGRPPDVSLNVSQLGGDTGMGLPYHEAARLQARVGLQGSRMLPTPSMMPKIESGTFVVVKGDSSQAWANPLVVTSREGSLATCMDPYTRQEAVFNINRLFPVPPPVPTKHSQD